MPPFDLLTQLHTHQPFNDLEAAFVQSLQQFLAHCPNAYERTNLYAHVVADAWIVNPARTHVVLIQQLASGAWMAPGGHCDGNPDVLAAARREVREETGLTDLKVLNGGQVFDLNCGAVPSRLKTWGLEPTHLHFDVCFAFEAPDQAPLQISDESTGLAWVPVADVPTLPGYWPEHLRRVEKTRAGLLA